MHSGSINKIKWCVAPDKLDLMKMLPLFCTWLVEKSDPTRILAIMGCFELVEFNKEELIRPVIPLIIMPLKIGLNLRDEQIVIVICKFL